MLLSIHFLIQQAGVVATMANRTDFDAVPVHGNDPQEMIEKAVREQIYTSVYWQIRCFGQSAAGVVHLAVRLRYVGGAVGVLNEPSPFLCLLLKLLQLGPEPPIVDAYLQQDDFKYARALAAFYVRITGRAVRVYSALEPLLADFRKLIIRHSPTDFSIIRLDEFVESLLTEPIVCGITLPRLPVRTVLVDAGQLKPRKSALPPDDLAALDAVTKSATNMLY